MHRTPCAVHRNPTHKSLIVHRAPVHEPCPRASPPPFSHPPQGHHQLTSSVRACCLLWRLHHRTCRRTAHRHIPHLCVCFRVCLCTAVRHGMHAPALALNTHLAHAHACTLNANGRNNPGQSHVPCPREPLPQPPCVRNLFSNVLASANFLAANSR